MTAPQPSIQVMPLTGFLDDRVYTLQRDGFSLVSAEELAILRYSGNFLRDGLVVGDNYNYFPDGVRIAKRAHNPILKNAREAAQAHRTGAEFYLDDRIAREMTQRSRKTVSEARETGVLFVPWNEMRDEIPVDQFGADAVTSFLFGQYREVYAHLLNQRGIRRVKHRTPAREYAAAARSPFAYSLFIQSMDYYSNLDGTSDLTHSKGKILGVRWA